MLVAKYAVSMRTTTEARPTISEILKEIVSRLLIYTLMESGMEPTTVGISWRTFAASIRTFTIFTRGAYIKMMIKIEIKETRAPTKIFLFLIFLIFL